LRACLLAALPNRAFLLSCERDARAPSTRDAGNAGVPPALPTAREKTYPFKNPPRGRGGSRGSSPVHGGGWEGGMLKNQRKGTYYTAKARLVNIAVAAASVQARAFSIRYNSFRCRAIMCRC